MLSVIKKDILINPKFVLFTLLYSIFVPILLNADTDKPYWMISVLLPLMNVGFTVGKAIYVEDSEEVQVFLKSLPLKYSTIVLSKYVQVAAILLLTYAYAILVENFYMNNLRTIILGNMFSLFVYLVYFAVYLYLYYKKNYFYAQNSIYFLLVAGFAFYFLFHNLLKISFNLQMINIGWVTVMDIVGILLFVISYRFSLKEDRN